VQPYSTRVMQQRVAGDGLKNPFMEFLEISRRRSTGKNIVARGHTSPPQGRVGCC